MTNSPDTQTQEYFEKFFRVAHVAHGGDKHKVSFGHTWTGTHGVIAAARELFQTGSASLVCVVFEGDEDFKSKQAVIKSRFDLRLVHDDEEAELIKVASGDQVICTSLTGDPLTPELAAINIYAHILALHPGATIFRLRRELVESLTASSLSTVH